MESGWRGKGDKREGTEEEREIRGKEEKRKRGKGEKRTGGEEERERLEKVKKRKGRKEERKRRGKGYLIVVLISDKHKLWSP